MIYDRHNFSPLFREDDLVVVDIRSVRAIIEVKTTLTSSELDDALQLLYDASHPRLYQSPIPIFKGIFAFAADIVKPSTIEDHIVEFYNGATKEGAELFPRRSEYFYQWITSVCVPHKHNVFLRAAQFGLSKPTYAAPQVCSLVSNSSNNVQFAVFLSLLFSHLDVSLLAKGINVNYFRALYHEMEIAPGKYLHGPDWLPTLHLQNEKGSDAILEKSESIFAWFAGEIDSAELLSRVSIKQA